MTAKHLLQAGIALLAVALPAYAGTPGKAAFPKPAEDKSELSFANGILTLDLEERLRWEVRNNNKDFNDSVNDVRDDGWLLSRFRLGLAIRPTPWVKIYGQTQDTREWFAKRGNVPGVNGCEGGDYFDLRQAYVQIGNFKEFPLGVTVGRQPLNYGDNRLVADSKWGNFGRTFDAVKLRFQTDKFWVDAFAARPVQIRKNEFNDSDSADNFFGVYGGTDALGVQTTELYFLYRDKADNQPDLDPTNKINPVGSYNGPAQRIATIGTRWKSKEGALHGFDYTAEFAYQFGDLWTGDKTTKRLNHHAFATALKGGYTFAEAPWTPRIGLEYDYASGDKNPADGNSQSFQNLFPSNHAKFGAMDEVGWRNLHDLHFVVSAKPVKSVELALEYNALWAAETSDYVYGSNGNSIFRTTTPSKKDVRTIGAGNFLGHEVDFTATWKVNSHLSLLAGYSHLFAGDYIRDTGPHDGADFGYLQATLSF